MRQPHCSEAATLLEEFLIQSHWYWGCMTKLAELRLPHIAWNTEGTSLRLLLWGYMIYWGILVHLACQFPRSWFLNLLILVPQARLPCLQLFTTLPTPTNWSWVGSASWIGVWQYITVKNYTGLNGTILEYSGLYRPKQDYTGLCMNIKDYTGLCRT